MAFKPMKVGELARATSISVRALHHYDDIGLLRPSHRTSAGHRLYDQPDIARLHQIKSLQQLGFSLEEIGRCLDRPEFALPRVLELHLARVTEQIGHLTGLRDRLERLTRQYRSSGKFTVEQLLEAIEGITMYEKYYTPEQLEQLKRRREMLGEERIEQGQEEWQKLLHQFRAEREKGSDPESESVQALVRKAQALIEEFTGGDPGLYRSLQNLYRSEGMTQVMSQHGINHEPGVYEFLSKAMAHGKKEN